MNLNEEETTNLIPKQSIPNEEKDESFELLDRAISELEFGKYQYMDVFLMIYLINFVIMSIK